MKISLIFLALVGSLFASGHPAEQIAFTVPDSVTLARGRSAEFYVTAVIPAEHHVYLKHANKNGRAILTTFSVPGEAGFQLRETKRPAGTKLENEFILRNKGMFLFELSELAMNDDGKTLSVPLRIRVQICGEGEAAICYMPATIEKKITVNISGPQVRTRDLPDATLPWMNSYSAAIDAAKLKNQNVFALISEPSSCGACAYLESKVLPDAAVNKMLKNRFVVYRVPENEYGKAEISGSFGIPYYFIISPEGKNLQKWMGAPGAPQFAQRLEPFAKDTAPVAPVAPVVPTDAIRLASCKIPLKQSFAYQATQKGDFRSSGNLRFVLNNSTPGAYTVLAIDRTGEIEGSYNARVVAGKLVVEKYLAGRDLPITCSQYGVTGTIDEQALQISIDLK
jgi:hypothetical protein